MSAKTEAAVVRTEVDAEIRRLRSALIHHAAELVNMHIVDVNPDIEYLRRYDVMTVAIRMRESCYAKATKPKGKR